MHVHAYVTILLSNHFTGSIVCHNGSSQSAGYTGEAKRVQPTPSGHPPHHEPDRCLDIFQISGVMDSNMSTKV